MLTTRGEDVKRIEEASALRTLLGSVDSEAEAVIVAALAGLEVRCPSDGSQALSGTQVRSTEDGYEVRTDWEECGEGLWRDEVAVSADGTTGEPERESLGRSNCTVGRRPEGLRAAAPVRAGSQLGAYLAGAARLEAASVHAFARLARELTTLSAPRELVAACLASALDEVRHARVVSALAARFGGVPAPVEGPVFRRRSVLEIALENAVEGCVRETFGAVIGQCQAELAADPQVREAMRRIASDESRHALLAWQVAAFLEPWLSAPEVLAVSAARGAALLALDTELGESLEGGAARILGLPAPEVQRALLKRMAEALALS